MSDLQDALDLHDEWMTGVSWNPNDPHSQAILVIVEAARKYANPNIEAGVEVLAPHSREIYGRVDELVKEIVDAALGVTEAPDG